MKPPTLLRKVKDKVEAISLPAVITWNGAVNLKPQAKRKPRVFSSIPMGYLAMFLITVFLFNSVRQPLVIWFTVPLALIDICRTLVILTPLSALWRFSACWSLSGHGD